MRKLLNTLYVTTPESYLSKDGQNVVISVRQKETFRIPIINLEGIITFGYSGASPGLMKLCSENNVALTFLTSTGAYIGRFQGKTHGNVLLRKEQYNLCESEESLHAARIMISGKINNYRAIVMRFLRDHGSNFSIEQAAQSLEVLKRKALNASDKQTAMGIEGEAASVYFGVMDNLILNQKASFSINCRNKRPPKDPVNALLSFVYTLLSHDCAAALEAIGLDPYVGFLHSIRPGRTSLALDIMEEFRAYLCDRLVLSLINRKQITINDFILQGEDSILLTEAGRKSVLSAWQGRKKETIEHPFLHEKVEIGLLPYIQAMLLARYIRKEIDDYPVFLIH